MGYIIFAAAVIILVLWLTKLDDKAQKELDAYNYKRAEEEGYN